MPLARREESNDDHLLLGRCLRGVSIETDPHHDINADAKFWSPDTERWVDCPGSTGIGTDVLYSVDFYPIPADAVEEMQTRCRDLMARRAAPGSTSGYTPRPRPSRLR